AFQAKLDTFLWS
nr:Chain D, ALA-PHE-GLN-ALA-LYS-LEU-ASP-THR-PHE-LEU-TRP-SER [Homo sapiens]4ZTD_E Chain E, ALA-PHE-GLN-ALA-LYS-LEU-ASP-THR-PHE-LEU-TRP-SER [Homo sapiens]